MDFVGKKVIVTGAGKGIGRACARIFVDQGAEVIALSRTGSDLVKLEAELGCRTQVVDLADAKENRAAMDAAGCADYLVNSAGINVLESALEMSDDGYDTVLAVNLRAALLTCQSFAKMRLSAGGGGAIVNITSIAGHRGFENHLAYAASKAGLEGASRVLSKELGPSGIRVNCVAPTITMTELAAAAWSDPVKSEPMAVRHPIGRFAEAEEVAAAVAFLCSDAAAMISGVVLPVDGGFLSV